MAWGDPTASYEGPSWDYVAQSPALQQALLSFGTNMLANAHRPRLQGVGESIGAGFGAYQAAKRKADLDALLAAKGQAPGFGNLYASPGHALAQGGPAAPDLTGVGAANLGAPSAAPNLGAPDLAASPFAGSPRYPGAFAGQQAPGGATPLPHPISAPALPQSPFGPGPWGTAAPPVGSTGFTPSNPYPMGGPLNVVPLGSQGPSSPAVGSEFQTPGPLSGLLGGGVPGAPFGEALAPPLRGAAGRDVQLGGADRDVLANAPLWQRNNNPGNLRYAGQEGAEKGDAGFARFDSMEAGIDALKKQIGRYGSGATTGKPLRSLRQIIGTYSPPNENQTDLLIKNAAQRLGVSPDQELDTADPAVQDQLANVLTQQETGRSLADLGAGSPTARRTQVADVSGSRGQAAMAGGAEGDIPQPPSYTFQPRPVRPDVADVGGAGVPPQAPGGLLGDDTGGIWNTRGELTEDAKRTLRLANAAGGPEGVQQMLMQMANRKPEIGGSAEAGYFSLDPWSGKVKQLTAPKAVKQSRILKPEEAQALVGPAAYSDKNVYELDEKNDLTINKPGGEGVTVNLGDKADQGWTAAGIKQSGEWTAGGRKLGNTVAQMGPATEILKDAVINNKPDITGFGSAETLSLRRAAQSLGLPVGENVQAQEMINGLKAGLMADLHEPGMGTSSDWESQAMIEAGPSLDKSTEGNYILVKGLEAQAARKLWLGRQSEKYMDAIDPVTKQPRNNLKGFDEWLNTPGADGHAPIENQPHLMADTSKMSLDQIKATKPGDVLFVDGKVKVRPKEILDDRTMSPEQAQNLRSGSLVILDGQLRVMP